MQSHNQFSINLNQQKARAKKLLKSIKQGDSESLALINKFHSSSNHLNVDNIKLADVQFSIARELGLSSWNKLKLHVEELERHRKAIDAGEQALDADMPTLHVRCGHDIQQSLKIGGFSGDFLPMIDPLCMGPIPSDEKRFIALRAAYVVETLIPNEDRERKIKEVIEAEQRNCEILLSGDFKRVVLWVEHDSYDQFMLLRALNLLENHTDKVIEIIELNQFPGTGRFIGIGQLPTEAIRSCWQHRKPLSAKLLLQAKMAWNALRSKKPDAIMSLLSGKSLDCLPNMSNVFKRHLQELPHVATGLSMTQSIGLNVLKKQSNSVSFKEWFPQYQKLEPLPFLGDGMFYRLMLPLSRLEQPLFTIEPASGSYFDQKFTITQRGIACLSGESKVAQDYWVGGICVQSQDHWTWDHSDLTSIKHQRSAR